MVSGIIEGRPKGFESFGFEDISWAFPVRH